MHGRSPACPRRFVFSYLATRKDRNINRRTFLRRSGLITGAALLNRNRLLAAHNQNLPVAPALDANSLERFVDHLPIPAIVRKSGVKTDPTDHSRELPYYRIEMGEFQAKVHRDLSPTKQWGYGRICPGPTLETRSGEGLLVEWVNALPDKHFLPIDHKLHGAEADKPEVRAVVHLHGAKAPPESDGYPENWFVPGKSSLCHYPNEQDAAMLWYHDHAMGINRLNIYGGLMGAFLIRDKHEDDLNLPKGRYEISLVIYDRMLRKDGQLDYPVSDKAESIWVPEVFGDAVLVNGKLFPYLNVEPRKYRFRLLNGSNGRFYNLTLGNGATIRQIGTDQGLLPAPVELKNLQIAPAERADLIIDFAGHAGEQIILKDETVEVLQFRVSREKVADSSSLPSTLRPVRKIAESEAVKTRVLSLDEYEDPVGRNSLLMLLNGTYWHQPVTENPRLNSMEIWSFVNPTDDSHPIHLHLVRFQVLDRRPIEAAVFKSNRQIDYLGPAVPPDPNEAGWKDTVRADSSMVTRIIVPFEGFAGRYVWHCHILEHEDNEMMRPYDVIAP